MFGCFPNDTRITSYNVCYTKLLRPVVIYNIPGRTGQNLAPDLIAELADHPGIVGVKEASGDINQISTIIELTLDKDFTVVSGDDGMTLPILGLGGGGVISVVANIMPKPMIEMYNAAKKGDFETARTIHYNLAPLIKALFVETNPVPIKKATEIRGSYNFV